MKTKLISALRLTVRMLITLLRFLTGGNGHRCKKENGKESKPE
jgi:hypothetical protein